MSDKTPGQAAFETFDAMYPTGTTWSDVHLEYRRCWEAIAERDQLRRLHAGGEVGVLDGTLEDQLERARESSRVLAEELRQRDDQLTACEAELDQLRAEHDRCIHYARAIGDIEAFFSIAGIAPTSRVVSLVRELSAERDKLSVQYKVSRLDADSQRKRCDQMRATIERVEALCRDGWVGLCGVALDDGPTPVIRKLSVEQVEKALKGGE